MNSTEHKKYQHSSDPILFEVSSQKGNKRELEPNISTALVKKALILTCVINSRPLVQEEFEDKQ